MGILLTIIGKPRMYNNEKYVVPEIIKIIKNKKWIEVRKKELEQRKKQSKEPVNNENKTEREIKKEFSVEPVEETVEEIEEPGAFQRIKQYVKENDSGKGVSIAELETLNVENFDVLLQNLLSEGELYEVRPGFIKLLE